MDTPGYEAAEEQVIAICRKVAAESVDFQGALAWLAAEMALETDKGRQEYLQAMELIFKAVGAVHDLGRLLKTATLANACATVRVLQSNAAAPPPPSPSNVFVR